MKINWFLSLFLVLGCVSQPPEGNETTLPFLLVDHSAKTPQKHFKWSSQGPMEAKDAKKLFAGREVAISQLMTPTIDPYKGEDSTPKICRKESLPAPLNIEGKDFSTAFSLYSSSNMILGSCLDPKNLLKTQYQMLYCEKTKMAYFVQYFYENNEPWLQSFVAKCESL